MKDVPRAIIAVPIWLLAVIVFACFGWTVRFGRWLNDDGMKPHWHP